jgi:toxin ParE1/3/4
VIARRLRVRSRANRDIQATVDRYREEGSPKVALGSVDALEHAFGRIRRNPMGGSPRYAQELDIPGLRHRLLKRHPYLIFYVAHEHTVDILRVVHAHRDIPASLQSDV